MDAGDLLELLGKAITCAVLGKAGPQRSRQMGVLLKDERIENLSRIPGLSTHAQVRRDEGGEGRGEEGGGKEGRELLDSAAPALARLSLKLVLLRAGAGDGTRGWLLGSRFVWSFRSRRKRKAEISNFEGRVGFLIRARDSHRDEDDRGCRRATCLI